MPVSQQAKNQRVPSLNQQELSSRAAKSSNAPSTVRDRVLRWQEQIGDEVERTTTERRQTEINDEQGGHKSSDHARKVDRSSERHHLDDRQKSRQPEVSLPLLDDAAAAESSKPTRKTATAPGKRIISDGHWQRKRASSQGHRVISSRTDHPKDASGNEARSTQRRNRLDGVYVKSEMDERSGSKSNPLEIDARYTTRSKDGDDIVIPRKTRKASNSKNKSSPDKTTTRKTSKTTPQLPQDKETMEIFALAGANPISAPRPRIPSVQAWLEETPDPSACEPASAEDLSALSHSRLSGPKNHRRPSSKTKRSHSPTELGDSRINKSREGNSSPPSICLNSSRRLQDSSKPILEDDYANTCKIQSREKEQDCQNDGLEKGLKRRSAMCKRRDADATITSPPRRIHRGIQSPSNQRSSSASNAHTPPADHTYNEPTSSRPNKDHSELSQHAKPPGVFDTPHNDHEKSILNNFVKDEEIYLEELDILLDGVVPTLLSCLLSKVDSVSTLEIFNVSLQKTKPSVLSNNLIAIGISLERLRSLHRRMKSSTTISFLEWCRTAQRTYLEYLEVWRMDFQDVVLGIETVADRSQVHTSSGDKTGPARVKPDQMVVEEQIIDVTFLLRRPLIRLKYLGKTVQILLSRGQYGTYTGLVEEFAILVNRARDRVQLEKARLEDQLACNLESYSAVAIQNLKPNPDAQIDDRLRVKARDRFRLYFPHSTGQLIECETEWILRSFDDDHKKGDILICKVDGQKRSLLFAPVSREKMSARLGDSNQQLLIMVHGDESEALSWRETMRIEGHDSLIMIEWLDMLGSDPRPDDLAVLNSTTRDARLDDGSLGVKDQRMSHPSRQNCESRDIALSEQVPIDHDRPAAEVMSDLHYTTDPEEPIKQISRIRRKPVQNLTPSLTLAKHNLKLPHSQTINGDQGEDIESVSDCYTELRNTRDGSLLQNFEALCLDGEQTHIYKVDVFQGPDADKIENRLQMQEIQSDHEREPYDLREEELREAYSSEENNDDSMLYNALLMDKRERLPEGAPLEDVHSATKSSTELRASTSKAQSARLSRHRSSSPLKKEYAPSSSDTSDTDDSILGPKDMPSTCDSFEDEHDEELENKGRQLRLENPSAWSLPDSKSFPSRPPSLLDSRDAGDCVIGKAIAMVLSWSETGTWKPLYPDECSIVVSAGMIEAHQLSAIHSFGQQTSEGVVGMPTENTYDDNMPRTSELDQRKALLISLELTPLVPIRRGTALDITVRSPPKSGTPASACDNFLFRSRTPRECEALYAMINHARIHNPTYIAMQNVAPAMPLLESHQEVVRGRLFSKFTAFKRGSRADRLSRTSSYRAGTIDRKASQRPESVHDSKALPGIRLFGRRTETETTKTSLSGALSRLEGTAPGNSLGTSSGASSNNCAPFQMLPGMVPDVNGSLALRDAAVRLYIRENSSKWRTMGAALLTIVRAEVDTERGQILEDYNRQPGPYDKRLLLRGKSKGQVLIDAQLDESCYERVARTGIAVSIWEDVVGPDGNIGVVGAEGGVNCGRAKVYMIQFKTEVETAFAFSLVGKLRY